MCHHAWLTFIFLVETGFHHVGQDGLDLLTSGDLPTLASQSAEITGVSHRTQPTGSFINVIYDQVQQLMPIIPTLWEAEVGGSLEVRSLRSAWTTG